MRVLRDNALRHLIQRSLKSKRNRQPPIFNQRSSGKQPHLDARALIHSKGLERRRACTRGDIFVPHTPRITIRVLLHGYDEVELLRVGGGRERDVGKIVSEVDGGREYIVVHGDKLRELVAVEVLECGTGRFEDCASCSVGGNSTVGFLISAYPISSMSTESACGV